MFRERGNQPVSLYPPKKQGFTIPSLSLEGEILIGSILFAFFFGILGVMTYHYGVFL